MTALNVVSTFPRTSPLNDITLREPIDENLLDKCIHSDLLVTHYKDSKWFKDEKTHLQAFKKSVYHDEALVKYTFKDGYNFGRMNVVKSRGLHSIRRETRHTLVNGKMVDVDMENAHLNLLLQVLQHNNYEGDYKLIEDYVINRKKWFGIIDKAYCLSELDVIKNKNKTIKDIAKNLVLRITYGGSVKEWISDWGIKVSKMPKEIASLITEVGKVFEYICEKNPELHSFCMEKNIEKGKNYNHLGTTASWFLQDKECLVLESMYEYCVDNGYIQNDTCSLCNDGIMLEKKYYNSKLLTDMNVYVKEKTGFDMVFVEKPLSDGYENILDDHIIFDYWTKDITDGICADYFKMLYHKQFIHSSGSSYFYNGVYWVKDESGKNIMINNKIDTDFKEHIFKKSKSVSYNLDKDWKAFKKMDQDENISSKDLKLKNEAIVKSFETKYYYKKPEDRDINTHFQILLKDIHTYMSNMEKYLRNVGTRDRLAKDVCRVLDNSWIVFDNNPFLLAFRNKVYDLEKSEFVAPEYSQYISLTTGWDWVKGYSSSNKDRLMGIIDMIFPDPDVKQHYLTMLSTGLYGAVIQHFFVAKGVGGNGKSMLNGMMMRTIGEYGYKLPSLAVSAPIKEGANPTIANMNNKRFVLVQEPDKKNKINTSTIKELTGDKAINCRTLYSKATTTLLKLTFCMECNDLPQLDESGDAMARRIDVTPFDSMFMNSHLYEGLTNEEKATGKFHLANPLYNTDDFQDNHKQALMEILMHHFKVFKSNKFIIKPPRAVIQEASEYLKYSDDFYGWFSNAFKKKEGCHISFKAIYRHYSNSDYFSNLTKSDKRKHNAKFLKNTILNNMFLKKHFKQARRVYCGLKLENDSVVGYEYTQNGNDDDSDDEDTTDNADEN